MLVHTQLPPSCSCCPHQHYQFAVLNSSHSNNGFCVPEPGLFLSKDNPCDTDCLILPEPNCGRDKERVKDVPAHCFCHPSSGEQETPLQHPALLRRGRARQDTQLGGATRTHVPLTQSIPRPRHTEGSQAALPSLPHTLLLPQLPSCCRNVSPADTRTLSGPIRLGKRLGPTPIPGPKQQQRQQQQRQPRLEAVSWGKQESQTQLPRTGGRESS